MPVSIETVVSTTRALIETFGMPSMRQICIETLRKELDRLERELNTPKAKPNQRRDVSTFTGLAKRRQKVSSLPLATATKTALERKGYTTVGKIVRSSNEQLLTTRNFSRTRLDEVLAVLTRLEQAEQAEQR